MLVGSWTRRLVGATVLCSVFLLYSVSNTELVPRVPEPSATSNQTATGLPAATTLPTAPPASETATINCDVPPAPAGTLSRAERFSRVVVVLSTYAGANEARYQSLLDPMLGSWLSSVRTVVATDVVRASTKRAFYVYSPDAPANLKFVTWNGNNVAESRKLAGISYVREHLEGTYDWLIVIDDDSYVFIDKFLALAKTLDAGLPWALALIHPPGSVCGADKRCCTSFDAPCKMSQPWTAQDIEDDKYCRILPDDRMPLGNGMNATDGKTNYHGPSHWPYGGASFALSRGAVEALSIADWRQCHDQIVCDGGDVRVATCLLSANILFTATKEFSADTPPKERHVVEAYLNSGMASFHRVVDERLPLLYCTDLARYP